jgi:hypothetical protein
MANAQDGQDYIIQDLQLSDPEYTCSGMVIARQ